MDYKGTLKIIKDAQRNNDMVAILPKSYTAKVLISALQELQMYKENKLSLIPDDVYKRQCEELDEYKKLGTLKEVREALEKQKAKKPIYNHYENAGEPQYVKVACPNGCRIRLYPVTDKHLAYEHDYCPKCGQSIDWSGENE